jgi:hypothetical protein
MDCKEENCMETSRLQGGKEAGGKETGLGLWLEIGNWFVRGTGWELGGVWSPFLMMFLTPKLRSRYLREWGEGWNWEWAWGEMWALEEGCINNTNTTIIRRA